MRLVIAEKPSVARDLARVLGATRRGAGYLEGRGLVVTWCVGHLLELEDPAHYNAGWKRWQMESLPMVPERFALRVRRGAGKQWGVVRGLLREGRFEGVINACDAGREGELIFRYVYQLSGCRKPVQRLWVSSLTDQAIQTGWSRLEPGRRYDPLADAARCRSEADWLVGMNATRAATCLARRGGSQQLYTVGRVQTPTLALIVERDAAIERFVPQTYYQIKALLESGEKKATWEATWFDAEVERQEEKERRVSKQRKKRSSDEEGGEAAVPERVMDKAVAEAIAAASRGARGVVEEAKRRRKVERPPLLYDLTSLQRRANQRYGMSADRTLKLAQALYEKHKVITYPRTDARYLTPDQVGGLSTVLEAVGEIGVYAPLVAPVLAKPIRPGRRVVNAKEVGDHHAIIPTDKAASTSLDVDEKRIYDLVARRFIAVFYPDALFDLTTLVSALEPAQPLPAGVEAPLRFRARGRVCVDAGWRAVDPPGRSRDRELPGVEQGDGVVGRKARVTEGKTRPPKRFNDASLLRAMETAGRDLEDDALKRAMRNSGLGTPATRASILETLLRRNYLERKGRELRSTALGCALIELLPVDELKSPQLTARWESRLSRMAEGEEARGAFMRDVVSNMRKLIAAFSAAQPPASVAAAEDAGHPVLGRCPLCGKEVRESRAAFTCATGRACEFVIFKKVARRKVSPAMVKYLLREGRTRVLKGFRSRAGKPFSAALVLGKDGKVSFDFPERKRG